MRNAACLFSGGKDSVFSAWWASTQGFQASLLTIRSGEYSMMFHHPNIEYTKMQAEAMGFAHRILSTTKENELSDMEKELKRMGAEAIVSGAIASEYQKQRIEKIGESLGIPTYSPLWHKGQALLQEMLSNFEIYTVAVSAEGLGPELLGRPFSELVKKNVPHIHPYLEGGEGETFVSDAPFFRKRIAIDGWETSWDNVRGVAKIRKAHFETKN